MPSRFLPDAFAPYGIVSFDVFDTLVTRLVAEPADAFDLLAVRYGLGPRFRLTREAAESRARRIARKAGRHEVTLAEIYRELAVSLGWGAERTKEVMEGESALEVSLCVANPYGQRLFRSAQASGARLVAISDMYLPRGVVEAILGRCGYEIPDLFVSSEVGETKHSGGMFDVVRSQLGSVGTWLHVGDNRRSDDEVPRSKGIHTHVVPLPSVRPTRSSVAGLYAKAAAFSDDDILDDGTRFWRRIARAVASPMVVGLCLAARARADETGADRVYFLARDGRIAMEAYRELFPDDPRRLVYLFASRRAINFAGIERIDEGSLRFLKDGKKGMTIRGMLSRLSIPLEGLDRAVAKGLDVDLVNPPSADVEALFHDIADLVLADAAREREVLIDYLRHSGLDEGGDALVVDVGWNFSIQRSLARIARKEGWSTTLHGVYLGTKPAAHGADGGVHDALGWLCQGGRPRRDRDRLERSIEFVELMFAAPEHGILSIERTSDGFGAKRMEVAMEEGRIAIAATMREPILEMARLLRDANLLDVIGGETGREAALASLDGFLASPSREEASHAGAVRHSLGFGDSSYAPLVSPVGDWRSLAAWIKAFRESFWREGLAAMAPRPLDRIARIAFGVVMPLYRGAWRMRYERRL